MEPNVDKNTDFYKYVDCFARTEHIPTTCIFNGTTHQDADITIIIPTFKRIDTLEETLESALNQVGYEDYQIFVVDNNPERNDVTELFMQKYQGGRVSYFKNNENLGLCGNWNRCFTLAQSKWVCLLHDDDTIRPEFFSTMVPYLNTLPDVGILQSRKYRDRNNGAEFNVKYKRAVDKWCELDFYTGQTIDVPSGIIYNRDKVISLGGFNIDYSSSLDYCFNVRFTANYNVYVVNKPLTWYREGETNYSKQASTQLNWMIVDFYQILAILRRHNIPDYIGLPFIEERCIRRLKGDLKRWNTTIEIPKAKLLWIDYPRWITYLSYKLVRQIVKMNHWRIQDK